VLCIGIDRPCMHKTMIYDIWSISRFDLGVARPDLARVRIRKNRSRRGESDNQQPATSNLSSYLPLIKTTTRLHTNQVVASRESDAGYHAAAPHRTSIVR
jgi:hypothetical protein